MNRPLAAALAASALVLVGATPALASAKPAVVHHPKVSAETMMTNRSDSGGGGNNWATDDFTRTVVIEEQTATDLSHCGTTTGQCYLIAGAKLEDKAGTFTTIIGLAPNQGGTNADSSITTVFHGKMSGEGGFGPFYATELPDAHKVPATNDGDANPSTTWPELAFPAGTAFTGLSESTFSYSYHHGTQSWLDADSNDGGQIPAAGNITG